MTTRWILAKRFVVGFSFLVLAGATWLGCSGDEIRCYGTSTSYAAGSVYMDGCRQCTCNNNGSTTCVATAACDTGCVDDDGVDHDLGTFWPAGDSCNVCECVEKDTIQCTSNVCGAPCVYAGQQRPPGMTFPSIDGCNTCECTNDGGFSCTEQACACANDGSEWWRGYVGMSPAECQTIDYTCEANTTPFDNACGCGCEQSHACAETYNCTPPTSCDIAKIMADCPFSTIVE
jgi:hypothetical protein